MYEIRVESTPPGEGDCMICPYDCPGNNCRSSTIGGLRIRLCGHHQLELITKLGGTR